VVLESTWKVFEFKCCKFWNFAFIITVLVSTVQYTSVSHCSLNFECPCLGYGFLSIILVLEKCNLGPWKVLEFCPLSLLRTLSAAVIVDSSHMTGSSSTLWSILSPPSDFVNGHDKCRQCSSWCFGTCHYCAELTGISRNKYHLSLLTRTMELCCRQSLTITVIN